MPWNYRKYGSAQDPVHKSHLNAIVGDYGCPKQFRYNMDALADRKPGDDEKAEISCKAAAGTALHETIARALSAPQLVDKLISGTGKITKDRVRAVFDEEYAREVGGRQVRLYGKDEGKESSVLGERVEMIKGVLNGLQHYVAKVELIEPGFIALLEDMWLCGHIDLLYRPKSAPDKLAICDWKSGAIKPQPIELDHGWEAGVYSTAVKQGYFIPREQIAIERAPDGVSTTARLGRHTVTHVSRYIAEREVMERTLIDLAEQIERAYAKGSHPEYGFRIDLPEGLDVRKFGEFPSEIYCVHLGDYVPYKKAGTKAVKRPEDLKHYGYEQPQKSHYYRAGETKGPAWLPVKLSEYDVQRLAARMKNVVGMIRMGRFIDQVGDRCLRCTHAAHCLSGGYAPRGDNKRRLEQSLRGLDDDALADAAALSDE